MTLLPIACTGGTARPDVTDRQDGPFDTVRVSVEDSRLAQGETEVIADNQGRLVVVWMDGSPVNQARLTLRSAQSQDGGRSFSTDRLVAPGMRLVDPSLGIDSHGDVVLAALHKKSLLTYSDLDVVAFRDAGTGWSAPVPLNAEGVFNDRPWLGRRSDGRLIAVFGRRTPLPEGNFDRPVFAVDVPEAGEPSTVPEKRPVNPPQLRAPGTAGGSPRTVVLAGGRLVIGYQEIPVVNAQRGGAGIFSANAGVIFSEDNGRTFGRPIPFTTSETRVAEAGGEGLRAPADSFHEPFPRLGTDGRSVVAVWIGEEGTAKSAVYCALLRQGGAVFDPPVAVTKSERKAVTLATVAVDNAGRAHVFWLGRGQDRLWTLQYSVSDRGCSGFSTPLAVSELRFPLRRWPGDFMGATTVGSDVAVAWPVAGGDQAGVYVSIGRGLAAK
jgi:hypothetical protein